MSFRTQLAATETQMGYTASAMENRDAIRVDTAISHDLYQNSRLIAQITGDLPQIADLGFGIHRHQGTGEQSGSVTQIHGQERVLSPSVLIPTITITPTVTRPTLVALQEWEGIVAELGVKEFTARLSDLTDRTRKGEEEAHFPLREVSEDDLELLRVGAVFRWTIGFQKLGATKQRISQVVFRRLPQWTIKDIREADQLADQLTQDLDGA
jgi:hypothetical protein